MEIFCCIDGAPKLKVTLRLLHMNCIALSKFYKFLSRIILFMFLFIILHASIVLLYEINVYIICVCAYVCELFVRDETFTNRLVKLLLLRIYLNISKRSFLLPFSLTGSICSIPRPFSPSPLPLYYPSAA